MRRLTASDSTSLLERGARGKTTGRKANKANLLVFFGYRQPGRRAWPKPVQDWPQALGHYAWLPDHGRSHHDRLTEADAASLYRIAASPERTYNETCFTSRLHALNEAETVKQVSL